MSITAFNSFQRSTINIPKITYIVNGIIKTAVTLQLKNKIASISYEHDAAAKP